MACKGSTGRRRVARAREGTIVSGQVDRLQPDVVCLDFDRTMAVHPTASEEFVTMG